MSGEFRSININESGLIALTFACINLIRVLNIKQYHLKYININGIFYSKEKWYFMNNLYTQIHAQ